LLSLLSSNEQIKKWLFTAINENTWIFKLDTFLTFINKKEYLKDSFTKYKNRIGLAVGERFLDDSQDIVLNWPYKDCILEGGQSKDDQKRQEIFFNEILAPEQINRLLDEKVFVNFKKYQGIKKNQKIDGGLTIEKFKCEVSAGSLENIDFDKDNLIIKGNNLVVLHSLKSRFAGKVKLIYIDPPYYFNDVRDSDTFRYNSNFPLSTWLTFMRNRLTIAKELLADDGSIMVSMGDDGQAYMRLLMDEIFGVENYVATCPRKTAGSVTTKSDHELQKLHDYLLIYSKTKDSIYNKTIVGQKSYPYKDERGKYYTVPLQDNGPHGTRSARPNLYYEIYENNCGVLSYEKPKKTINMYIPKKHKGDDGCWMWSKKKFDSDYKDLIVENGIIKIKHYFAKDEDQNKYQRQKTWLDQFPNSQGTIAMNNRLDEKVSNMYPKPEGLIEWCLNLATKENDLVLDFFSGSGTTSVAAMKMKRRFIGIEQIEGQVKLQLESLPKVIENNQDAASFVYMSLANDSQDFIDEVDNAKSDEELNALLEKAKDSSFLSYRVDPEEFDDFEKLNISKKKEILKEVVDANTLYVNFADIDDEDKNIAEIDKKLNEKFYERS
jgi:adenine-specific DNA-methyltransferase